jgi:type IV pilus assembly protein PilA
MGFMLKNRYGVAASGFSLVELLVVIAVIAIIAAIALPNIASVTNSAETAKNQRNAQTLASTYNAAIASGMPTNAAADLSSAIDLIAAGTNITVGNTTHYFSVDGITPDDKVKAQAFLSFSNGRLVYLVP